MKSENVPCNGCTLCCRGDAIMVFPEYDDVDSYETVEWPPGTGSRILAHKDGHCIYLCDGGCTIYERRPLICRDFDCRKNFLKYTRKQRRRMVSAGYANQDVFDRGHELLPTLPERS